MRKKLSVIYQSKVPANSSRLFSNPLDAASQPSGTLELVWDPRNSSVRNQKFNESLIRWDHLYCTSNVDINMDASIATFDYFEREVAPFIGEKSRIVDIGCGQGEFVEALRNVGIEAFGFDPVLRAETEYLKARIWTTREKVSADLFVMRCVLPHIVRWEKFLCDLLKSHPESMVLVEFQSIEWIIRNGLWQQLSHDHVNLFTVRSFSRQFEVVSSGSFAEGEWNFVLLRRVASKRHSSAVLHGAENASIQEGFRLLSELRARTVFAVRGLGVRPVVWGAAGKGQVLAHALGRGLGTAAIDADPAKSGKYLELSAVRVDGKERGVETVVDNSVVLVSNPRHLGQVVDFVRGRIPVLPVDANLPRHLKDLR